MNNHKQNFKPLDSSGKYTCIPSKLLLFLQHFDVNGWATRRS